MGNLEACSCAVYGAATLTQGLALNTKSICQSWRSPMRQMPLRHSPVLIEYKRGINKAFLRDNPTGVSAKGRRRYARRTDSLLVGFPG